MRHAHNDNSRFHLGFLNISRCEPETGTDGRIDRLDIRITDAVFQASNGGVYRKLQAVAQDGSVHYGSAFAGRDGDFTKAMNLIVYYGVEKLTVPVPISDLVVGDSSSIDLFATIQAPQAKACPIAPEQPAAGPSLQEERLWSATELFIRAQPVRAKEHLTKLRRAVSLIYHPDQYSGNELEVRTRIMARANDLIDKLSEQIAA